MKIHRLFKSLRAQLPFSFAAIALLTTTLIGFVMYLTISNSYTKLERQYLDSNVHSAANNISRIAENSDITQEDSLADYKSLFQNQVKVTAFLIQSRVRILDNQGNIILDSGSPSKSWNITVPRPQNNDNQPPPPQDDKAPGVTPTASSNGTAEVDGNMESTPDTSSFSLEPSQNDAPKDNNDGPPAFSFEANPNMFGYLLSKNASSEYDIRSSVVVSADFYDKSHNVLGTVELSEAPKYSQRIITDVIRGWGVASLIGVLVSTILGYLISRGLTKPLVNLESVASEMKDGNYEVRSPIYRPDEFASLSDTFNQMATHIQHNIETLRQFVSDAAHEIRTPLTSLRADLNLALSEKTLNKAMPMIHRSLEQVDRLDKLSKDLLDLSKLESKNEKLDFAEINLTDLLMETSEIHASAAEQAEVDFIVHLPQEAITINGDAQQLQRAVSNLLSNAVKFTPQGGKVTMSLYTESDSALILVEDNGIGIPVEEREGLFNRFHRGKNTQNYPGAGLGLAISKAIVEKHNGIIGLLPDKDKTIFFIQLPLLGDSPEDKKRAGTISTRPA
jgi:signal transduction histidine kinase